MVSEGARRDALLADLYETVLEPKGIPEVLRRLNDAVDSDGLHLIGMDEAREICSSASSPARFCAQLKANISHTTPRLIRDVLWAASNRRGLATRATIF